MIQLKLARGVLNLFVSSDLVIWILSITFTIQYRKGWKTGQPIRRKLKGRISHLVNLIERSCLIATPFSFCAKVANGLKYNYLNKNS